MRNPGDPYPQCDSVHDGHRCTRTSNHAMKTKARGGPHRNGEMQWWTTHSGRTRLHDPEGVDAPKPPRPPEPGPQTEADFQTWGRNYYR